MKKVTQNLQKQGYMAPRAEACEMMQETCILKGSIPKNAIVIGGGDEEDDDW